MTTENCHVSYFFNIQLTTDIVQCGINQCVLRKFAFKKPTTTKLHKK